MRDHAPDPAAWMVDVTGIAGDDMDVAVHHALAGNVADVCADIMPVWGESFFAQYNEASPLGGENSDEK